MLFIQEAVIFTYMWTLYIDSVLLNFVSIWEIEMLSSLNGLYFNLGNNARGKNTSFSHATATFN